jgi:hypothetical protein
VLALAGAAAGCFRVGFDGAPPPTPEGDLAACTNGADDDGDALADCLDDGCAAVCADCVPASCAPGFARCLDGSGVVQLCDQSGALFCPVGACAADQVCAGGRCLAPDCNEGETACDDDGAVTRCLAGTLLVPASCGAGEVCDPTLGDVCRAMDCPTPGAAYCSGPAEVSGCTPFGVSSGVADTCAPGAACTGGACTGPCSAPGACDFLFVGVPNIAGAATLPHAVVVANAEGAPVQVAVQTRVGGEWLDVAVTTVSPLSGSALMVPNRHAEGTGISPLQAYRFRAESPVVPHVLTVADMSVSTAAFALWPVARLGTSYRVVTLPHDEGAEDWTGMVVSHPGGFVVMGAFDGTTVEVTVTAASASGPGVPALAPGESYQAVLNEGDVFQVVSAASGDDLTGSAVVADAPVGVIVFHACTMAGGSAYCDQIAETIPPVDRLGTTYVVPLDVAATEKLVRVVAAWPDTMVDFLPGAGVTGGPFPGVLLQAGEHVDVEADVAFALPVADLVVSASQPVLVALLHGPRESLAVVRPVDAWEADYHFAITASTVEGIAMVRTAGDTVSVDGSTASATWLMDGAGYEAGVLWTLAAPFHHVWQTGMGSGFGVVARGDNGGTSWAFDVGTGW